MARSSAIEYRCGAVEAGLNAGKFWWVCAFA
jgi:hypothetical protein